VSNATITWRSDDTDKDAVPAESPRVLAGRYELQSFLGAGGSGQVHRARDHLTKQDVAVKLVSRGRRGADRNVRRELASLRLLDLPGVVRLLDDGVVGGDGAWFLVMELLEGGPFDRLADRGGFPTWAPQAYALLEALARVHFAGVVHRDLKPANILLDGRGWPVITDFGLAQEPALDGTRTSVFEGTPRFMAPEQLAGEIGDARADLYAIGTMFSDMLEGRDLPDYVRDVVQRMRASEPADRYPTAVDVLEALGADPSRVVGTLPDLAPVADVRALRELFHDPEPTFLHVAEDAATVLHARTGGAREAVGAELDRWVRQGRCHWDDSRIVMSRSAVERVLADDDPEMRALLERRHDTDEASIATAIVDHATQMSHHGQTPRALGLLDAALLLLTEPGPSRRVLERLASLALTLGREDAVRMAMYRAERAEATSLLGVLHGARLHLKGDPERGIAFLRVGGFSEDVELARLSHLILACSHAQHPDLDEALREAAQLCQGSRTALGRWHVWKGNAAYARSEYAVAVEEAETAAALLDDAPALRLSAWLNAGFAALEIPDLDRALVLASAAAASARQLRHGVAECNAHLLRRLAAFRLKQPQRPEPAYVDAAFALSDHQGAALAFREAAIAYRSGQMDVARELARRGAHATATTANPRRAALLQGLACAVGGGDAPAPGILGVLPGDLRAQVEALLAGAGVSSVMASRESVRDWLAAWPSVPADMPLDVLSRRECEELLVG